LKIEEFEPLTVKKMYRLVKIAWKRACVARFHEDFDLHIRPVIVAPSTTFFDYVITPAGAVLSQDSDDIIRAGTHLAVCLKDGTLIDESSGDFQLVPDGTFEEDENDNFRDNPSLREMSAMPDDVRDAVLKRDRGMCCFTGVPLDAKTSSVVWVLPPTLDYEMELSDSERFYDLMNTVAEEADAARLQGLKVASNAITIHRDLVTLFRTNQLSVDVGDVSDLAFVDFLRC
ncbi:hypothetical protein DXG03_001846, partial [Asterophora parasitica]